MDGQFNTMVVLREGHIKTQDILDAANKQRLVPENHRFIRAAREMHTCFGD